MNRPLKRKSKGNPGRTLRTVLALLFTIQQLVPPRLGIGYASMEAVTAPQVSLGTVPLIDIPEALGKIDEVVRPDSAKSSRLIVHVQNAHGNADAQNHIQALLKHLTQTQGIKTVFLEGGSSELTPEVFRFFPKDKNLNLSIAKNLEAKGELSGAEVYLIEGMLDSSASGIKAFGIEDSAAYRKNREDFQKVLKAREESEAFLLRMDEQIERLTAPLMGIKLRNYLRRLTDYETGHVELMSWLGYLKEKAKTELAIDLEDAYFQRDWPMLVRIFRLESIQEKVSPGKMLAEKKLLFQKFRELKIGEDLIKKMDAVLTDPGGLEAGSEVSYQEVIQTLGELLGELPREFSFGDYEGVKFWLQHKIIESEIQSSWLFKEISRLENLLSEHLAKTDAEKKLLLLFQDYRLMKKLFSLELTRDDFELLSLRRNELDPSKIVERFAAMNGEGRVREVRFDSTDKVEELYALAVSFYEGAKERDGLMSEKVMEKLKELGEEKAVVVTGGFHAGGMKSYFENQSFNYYRISPRIKTLGENKNYYAAMLEQNKVYQFSEIEVPLKEQPRFILEAQSSPEYLLYWDGVVAAALIEEAGEARLAEANWNLLADQNHMRLNAAGRIEKIGGLQDAKAATEAIAQKLAEKQITPEQLRSFLHQPEQPEADKTISEILRDAGLPPDKVNKLGSLDSDQLAVLLGLQNSLARKSEEMKKTAVNLPPSGLESGAKNSPLGSEDLRSELPASSLVQGAADTNLRSEMRAEEGSPRSIGLEGWRNYIGKIGPASPAQLFDDRALADMILNLLSDKKPRRLLSLGPGRMITELQLRTLLPAAQYPITMVEPGVTEAEFKASPFNRMAGIANISKPFEQLTLQDLKGEKQGLVYGQFSLEYMNPESAIAKLKELSEEDANFLFIFHHQGSIISEKARETILQLRSQIEFEVLTQDFLAKAIPRETYERAVGALMNQLPQAGQSVYRKIASSPDQYYSPENYSNNLRGYFAAVSQFAPFLRAEDIYVPPGTPEEILSTRSLVDIRARVNRVFSSEEQVRTYFEKNGFELLSPVETHFLEGRPISFMVRFKKAGKPSPAAGEIVMTPQTAGELDPAALLARGMNQINLEGKGVLEITSAEAKRMLQELKESIQGGLIPSGMLTLHYDSAARRASLQLAKRSEMRPEPSGAGPSKILRTGRSEMRSERIQQDGFDLTFEPVREIQRNKKREKISNYFKIVVHSLPEKATFISLFNVIRSRAGYANASVMKALEVRRGDKIYNWFGAQRQHEAPELRGFSLVEVGDVILIKNPSAAPEKKDQDQSQNPSPDDLTGRSEMRVISVEEAEDIALALSSLHAAAEPLDNGGVMIRSPEGERVELEYFRITPDGVFGTRGFHFEKPKRVPNVSISLDVTETLQDLSLSGLNIYHGVFAGGIQDNVVQSFAGILSNLDRIIPYLRAAHAQHEEVVYTSGQLAILTLEDFFGPGDESFVIIGTGLIPLDYQRVTENDLPARSEMRALSKSVRDVTGYLESALQTSEFFSGRADRTREQELMAIVQKPDTEPQAREQAGAELRRRAEAQSRMGENRKRLDALAKEKREEVEKALGRIRGIGTIQVNEMKPGQLIFIPKKAGDKPTLDNVFFIFEEVPPALRMGDQKWNVGPLSNLLSTVFIMESDPARQFFSAIDFGIPLTDLRDKSDFFLRTGAARSEMRADGKPAKLRLQILEDRTAPATLIGNTAATALTGVDQRAADLGQLSSALQDLRIHYQPDAVNAPALVNRVTRATFNYFLSPEIVSQENGLPRTGYRPSDPNNHHWSNPTEWGYYLNALMLGHQLGYINTATFVSKTMRSLRTMQTLQNDAGQNYHGLFYAYYYVFNEQDGHSPVGPNEVRHDNNHDIPSADNALLYLSLKSFEGYARSHKYTSMANLSAGITSRMRMDVFVTPEHQVAHLVNADTNAFGKYPGEDRVVVWDLYGNETPMVIQAVAPFVPGNTYKDLLNNANYQQASYTDGAGHTYRVATGNFDGSLFTYGVGTAVNDLARTKYGAITALPAIYAQAAYAKDAGLPFSAGFSDIMTGVLPRGEFEVNNPGSVEFGAPPSLNGRNWQTQAPIYAAPYTLLFPLNLMGNAASPYNSVIRGITDIYLSQMQKLMRTPNFSPRYGFYSAVPASGGVVPAEYQVYGTLDQAYAALSGLDYLSRLRGLRTMASFYRSAGAEEAYLSESMDQDLRLRFSDVTIEAESVSPAAGAERSNASGGKVLMLQNGDGLRTYFQLPYAEPNAGFQITYSSPSAVPAGFEIYIDGRRLDNLKTRNTGGTNNFTVSGRIRAGNLAAGRHVFTIIARGSAFEIDRIDISQAPSARTRALDNFEGVNMVGTYWDPDPGVYTRRLDDSAFAGGAHSLRVDYSKSGKPYSFFALQPNQDGIGNDWSAMNYLNLSVRSDKITRLSIKVVFEGGEKEILFPILRANKWTSLRFPLFDPRLGRIRKVDNIFFFAAPGDASAAGTLWLDNISVSRSEMRAAETPWDHFRDLWSTEDNETTLQTEDQARPARELFGAFIKRIIQQNPDAKLLDAGAGRFFVGRVAEKIFRDAGAIGKAQYYATDPVVIEPKYYLRFPGFNFKASRAEDLAQTFPSIRFDAATSSNGLEYSDWKQSLTALNRVLVPGGRFFGIVHHRHSVLTLGSGQGLTQLDFLDLVLSDVEPYLRNPTAANTPPATAALRKLENAINRPSLAMPATEILEAYRDSFQAALQARGTLPTAAIDRFIQILKENLSVRRRMLTAQIGSAVFGDENKQDLVNLFTEHGFKVIRLEPVLDSEGYILYWQIEAVKERELSPAETITLDENTEKELTRRGIQSLKIEGIDQVYPFSGENTPGKQRLQKVLGLVTQYNKKFEIRIEGDTAEVLSVRNESRSEMRKIELPVVEVSTPNNWVPELDLETLLSSVSGPYPGGILLKKPPSRWMDMSVNKQKTILYLIKREAEILALIQQDPNYEGIRNAVAPLIGVSRDLGNYQYGTVPDSNANYYLARRFQEGMNLSKRFKDFTGLLTRPDFTAADLIQELKVFTQFLDLTHRYFYHQDFKPDQLIVPQVAHERALKLDDFKFLDLSTAQVLGDPDFGEPYPEIVKKAFGWTEMGKEQFREYSIIVEAGQSYTGKDPLISGKDRDMIAFMNTIKKKYVDPVAENLPFKRALKAQKPEIVKVLMLLSNVVGTNEIPSHGIEDRMALFPDAQSFIGFLDQISVALKENNPSMPYLSLVPRLIEIANTMRGIVETDPQAKFASICIKFEGYLHDLIFDLKPESLSGQNRTELSNLAEAAKALYNAPGDLSSSDRQSYLSRIEDMREQFELRSEMRVEAGLRLGVEYEVQANRGMSFSLHPFVITEMAGAEPRTLYLQYASGQGFVVFNRESKRWERRAPSFVNRIDLDTVTTGDGTLLIRILNNGELPITVYRFDPETLQRPEPENPDGLRSEMRSLPDGKDTSRNIGTGGSEMRIEPAERLLINNKAAVLKDFVEVRKKFDVERKEWSSINKEEFLSESFDLMMILGSKDTRVPEEAAALAKKLRVNNQEMKILTSGKWGTHTGASSEFYEGEGAERKRISEAVYYANVMRGLGVTVDIVEPDSTDSGKNILFSRKKLDEQGLRPKRILIVQTPFLQARAGLTFLRQFAKEQEGESLESLGVESVVSYAPYQQNLSTLDDESFVQAVKVLIGEIERLKNSPALGYTVPINIPADVESAFAELKSHSAFTRSEMRVNEKEGELIGSISHFLLVFRATIPAAAPEGMSEVAYDQGPGLALEVIDQVTSMKSVSVIELTHAIHAIRLALGGEIQQPAAEFAELLLDWANLEMESGNVKRASAALEAMGDAGWGILGQGSIAANTLFDRILPYLLGSISVRQMAAFALSQIPGGAEAVAMLAGNPAGNHRLARALEDISSQDMNQRIRGAGILAHLGPEAVRGVPALSTLLLHPNNIYEVYNAAGALARIGPGSLNAITALITASNEFPSAASDIALALGSMGPAAVSAVPVLMPALQSVNERLRDNAASALKSIGPGAVPQLISALQSGNENVRNLSMGILADIGRSSPAEWQVSSILSAFLVRLRNSEGEEVGRVRRSVVSLARGQEDAVIAQLNAEKKHLLNAGILPQIDRAISDINRARSEMRVDLDASRGYLKYLRGQLTADPERQGADLDDRIEAAVVAGSLLHLVTENNHNPEFLDEHFPLIEDMLQVFRDARSQNKSGFQFNTLADRVFRFGYQLESIQNEFLDVISSSDEKSEFKEILLAAFWVSIMRGYTNQALDDKTLAVLQSTFIDPTVTPKILENVLLILNEALKKGVLQTDIMMADAWQAPLKQLLDSTSDKLQYNILRDIFKKRLKMEVPKVSRKRTFKNISEADAFKENFFSAEEQLTIRGEILDQGHFDLSEFLRDFLKDNRMVVLGGRHETLTDKEEMFPFIQGLRPGEDMTHLALPLPAQYFKSVNKIRGGKPVITKAVENFESSGKIKSGFVRWLIRHFGYRVREIEGRQQKKLPARLKNSLDEIENTLRSLPANVELYLYEPEAQDPLVLMRQGQDLAKLAEVGSNRIVVIGLFSDLAKNSFVTSSGVSEGINLGMTLRRYLKPQLRKQVMFAAVETSEDWERDGDPKFSMDRWHNLHDLAMIPGTPRTFAIRTDSSLIGRRGVLLEITTRLRDAADFFMMVGSKNNDEGEEEAEPPPAPADELTPSEELASARSELRRADRMGAVPVRSADLARSEMRAFSPGLTSRLHAEIDTALEDIFSPISFQYVVELRPSDANVRRIFRLDNNGDVSLVHIDRTSGAETEVNFSDSPLKTLAQVMKLRGVNLAAIEIEFEGDLRTAAIDNDNRDFIGGFIKELFAEEGRGDKMHTGLQSKYGVTRFSYTQQDPKIYKFTMAPTRSEMRVIFEGNWAVTMDWEAALRSEVKTALGDSGIEKLKANLKARPQVFETWQQLRDELKGFKEDEKIPGLGPTMAVWIAKDLFAYQEEKTASAAASAPQAPSPVEAKGPSLILPEMPLGFLTKGLGIEFHVPVSAAKNGFWQYELSLNDQERQVLDEKMMPAYNERKRPTVLRLVFQNQKPVLLISDGLDFIQLPGAIRRQNEEGLVRQFTTRYRQQQMPPAAAKKRAEREVKDLLSKTSVALGYAAFPLFGDEEEALFIKAKTWAESANPSAGTYSNELFVMSPARTSQPMVTIKGVYPSNTVSSDLFQSGVRPKKGTKILVLGAGPGTDAILAAEKTSGDIHILATDYDALAVQNALYNVQRFGYQSVITVAQADLFDISGRPAGEKFDQIYFNLPLPDGGDASKISVSDPGMRLLTRLLNEAGNHLQENGTLEINYTERPDFFSKLYAMGWEPAFIEGTDLTRAKLPNHTFDYSRFTLVNIRNSAREGQLSELTADWGVLASIDSSKAGRLNAVDQGKVQILYDKYQASANFNERLIAKAARALMGLPKLYLADLRLNENYPQYQPVSTRSEMRVAPERRQLEKAAQAQVNWLSEADDFSAKAPDGYLLLGNPDLKTFLEFARHWKQEDKKIPIFLAGGRGRGTTPLILRVRDYYESQGRLEVSEKEWLGRAVTDETVYESDILAFVLKKEGIAEEDPVSHQKIILREIAPSRNTSANFENTKPVIENYFQGRQNPVIALVSNPPLLRRVQATARKVWGAEVDAKRFRSYDIDLEKYSDADLIEVIGYIIGYPDKYTEAALPRGSELKGVRDMSGSAFTPEDAAQIARIKKSLEKFLDNFSLEYDPVMRRFNPRLSADDVAVFLDGALRPEERNQRKYLAKKKEIAQEILKYAARELSAAEIRRIFSSRLIVLKGRDRAESLANQFAAFQESRTLRSEMRAGLNPKKIDREKLLDLLVESRVASDPGNYKKPNAKKLLRNSLGMKAMAMLTSLRSREFKDAQDFAEFVLRQLKDASWARNFADRFEVVEPKAKVPQPQASTVKAVAMNSLIVSANPDEIVAELDEDLRRHKSPVIVYGKKLVSSAEFDAPNHSQGETVVVVAKPDPLQEKIPALSETTSTRFQLRMDLRDIMRSGEQAPGEGVRYQLIREDFSSGTAQQTVPSYILVRLEKDENPVLPRSEMRVDIPGFGGFSPYRVGLNSLKRESPTTFNAALDTAAALQTASALGASGLTAKETLRIGNLDFSVYGRPRQEAGGEIEMPKATVLGPFIFLNRNALTGTILSILPGDLKAFESNVFPVALPLYHIAAMLEGHVISPFALAAWAAAYSQISSLDWPKGSVWIDAGAGADAIMARLILAAHPGMRVLLIEGDKEEAPIAEQIMELQGYKKGIDFEMVQGDLTDPATWQHPWIQAAKGVIANVGPQEIYGDANAKLVEQVLNLPALDLFINGGFTAAEERQQAERERIQAAFQAKGFSNALPFDYAGIFGGVMISKTPLAAAARSEMRTDSLRAGEKNEFDPKIQNLIALGYEFHPLKFKTDGYLYRALTGEGIIEGLRAGTFRSFNDIRFTGTEEEKTEKDLSIYYFSPQFLEALQHTSYHSGKPGNDGVLIARAGIFERQLTQGKAAVHKNEEKLYRFAFVTEPLSQDDTAALVVSPQLWKRLQDLAQTDAAIQKALTNAKLPIVPLDIETREPENERIRLSGALGFELTDNEYIDSEIYPRTASSELRREARSLQSPTKQVGGRSEMRVPKREDQDILRVTFEGGRASDMVFDSEMLGKVPPEVQEKMRRIVSDYPRNWREGDYSQKTGLVSDKRAVAIALPAPLTIDGETYDQVEISGVLFTEENLGEAFTGYSAGGQARRATARESEQAVDVEFGADGRVAMTKKKFPQFGGHGSETAEKKFYNARTLLPSIGVRSTLVIGYGKFTPEKLRQLGVFITFSKSQSTMRFEGALAEVVDHFIEAYRANDKPFDRIATPQDPTGEKAVFDRAFETVSDDPAFAGKTYREIFNRAMEKYGEELWAVIAKGLYPNSPHFGNFEMEIMSPKPVLWHDLGGWRRRVQDSLPDPQAFAYAYWSLHYAISVIHRSRLGKLHDLNLFDPYAPFLKSFFKDRTVNMNDLRFDRQGRSNLEAAILHEKYIQDAAKYPPLIDQDDAPFVPLLRDALGMSRAPAVKVEAAVVKATEPEALPLSEEARRAQELYTQFSGRIHSLVRAFFYPALLERWIKLSGEENGMEKLDRAVAQYEKDQGRRLSFADQQEEFGRVLMEVKAAILARSEMRVISDDDVQSLLKIFDEGAAGNLSEDINPVLQQAGFENLTYAPEFKFQLDSEGLSAAILKRGGGETVQGRLRAAPPQVYTELMKRESTELDIPLFILNDPDKRAGLAKILKNLDLLVPGLMEGGNKQYVSESLKITIARKGVRPGALLILDRPFPSILVPNRIDLDLFIANQQSNSARSEMRAAYEAMAIRLMDGLIPAASSDLAADIYQNVYGSRLRLERGNANLAELVTDERMIQEGLASEGDRAFMGSILKASSQDFGLLGMPLPAGMTLSQVLEELETMKPLLANYPNQLLVLNYPKTISAEDGKIIQTIQSKFPKVFVVPGGENNADFFAGIFDTNNKQFKTIRRKLLEQAHNLSSPEAKISTSEALKSVSLIVGTSSDEFNDPNLNVNQMIDAFGNQTPEIRFRALVALGRAAVPLKKADELREVLKDAVGRIEMIGKIMRFITNPNFGQNLAVRMQAMMSILRSA